MVNKEILREALSKFTTGVALITTLDINGNVHAMTANAFTSVCLEPPLVLVCIADNTITHGNVHMNQLFGVNVLTSNQQPLAVHFAKPPHQRNSSVNAGSQQSSGGVPRIRGALAFFGCRVVNAYRHGDHTIFIGQVEELLTGSREPPLIFFESQFTSP